MKTAKFTEMIPENMAPQGTCAIALHSPTGRRLGVFAPGPLLPTDLGSKRYTFGILSDLHIWEPTKEGEVIYGQVPPGHTEAATARALDFLREKVDFLCIAGDMTHGNKEAEWQRCLSLLADHAPGLPVYPIAGNHDCSGSGMNDNRFRELFGQEKGLLYAFRPRSPGTGQEYEDDVFLMLSQYAWSSVSGGTLPFSPETLTLLGQKLEEYKNCRCFVFLHPFPWEHSGDPLGLYKSNSWVGDQEAQITALMKAYPNSLWFHGHSHQSFSAQSHHPGATYDRDFGAGSIHVPSVSLPYEIESGQRILHPEKSQGYLAEAYDNALLLTAMDFTTGKPIPLGCYCLETSQTA